MKSDKLRYAVLREIDEGNTDLTERNLYVSQEEFDNAVNYHTREGNLIGVNRGDGRPILEKIGPQLTAKGEDYLSYHSDFAKTYRGIKEIREWFKL
ncbi:YjcQ family protein [Geomicrobium sediminis]|uniref:Uncharacterized protein n=1 Tax=Geomicrobium sediminis TaxID=1347788 RepID=A0ABS2PFC7_9BACL|nr:YjcQ family protein [Geomicrobium sediminis]MBM7634061.1 hypothetical protein [Geomicrobium sediminis]